MPATSMRGPEANDKGVTKHVRPLCFLLATSDPTYSCLQRLCMGLAAFRTYVNKAILSSDSPATDSTTDPDQYSDTIVDITNLLQLARKELQQIVAMARDGSLIKEILSASSCNLEGEHISPFTQHNAVKFNALELALIGSILIGWTLQQSISVVASTMFSDTLLAAQEWILSRVVHYILTSASVRMDMDANIDTNMDICDLPTDVLNTVTHAISPNQPLTTVDFIAAIRIACSYMLTVFSDKFQFSATYSTKFGASLLRCTRSLTSDTLSARYLSELSALISLHMQHSNAIVSLIVSSECLLDMFSRWLRVILILGQDTGNICTLLSSIISSPIFSTGCVATARYRSGLVIKIFECLDAEVLQAIHAALESDGRQACAHMSGFMEMLVVTNMERLVSEAAPDIAPRLVPFLSAIVQTGVVVQRAKSHLKTSTWADLLAVTNASVLFSMTLIRLADSSKEYSVEVISKLLETTEGSVQELREFLLLQIMRFKVCHQVVDSLDENGMLMLTMLQNRISTILSE